MLVGDPKPISGRDHDPRVFVFLNNKTAIYVRREFLPAVLAKHGEGDDADDDGAVDDSKSMADFVANMTRLRRFSRREPNAAVIATVKDIRSKIRKGTARFTVPGRARAHGRGERHPRGRHQARRGQEERGQAARQRVERGPAQADRQSADLRPPAHPRALRGHRRRAEPPAGHAAQRVHGRPRSRCCSARRPRARARSPSATSSSPGWTSAPKQREALWKARKNGKLSPSEALEKLREEEEAKAGGPKPGPKRDPLEVGPKKPRPGAKPPPGE